MIIRQADDPLQDEPPEVADSCGSGYADNFGISTLVNLCRNPLRGKQLGFLAMLAYPDNP